jgi:hypothetical protein
VGKDMKKYLIGIWVGLLGFSSVYAGISANKIESALERFDRDPYGFMQELPEKSRDTSIDRNSKKLRRAKMLFRMEKMSQNNSLEDTSLKAIFEGNDNIESFFPGHVPEKNLLKMDELGLKIGEVDQKPWSDDYWPIAKGILGARYADQNFLMTDNWLDSFEYVDSAPVFSLYKPAETESVDDLSPSEKYDLLLGTPVEGEKGALTQSMWEEGKRYWDEYEEVESWMGICHGWAPASYILKRPENKIQVMAADNQTKINFYPADIKALASLLWANTRTSVNFMGGRCGDKEPKLDEDNGRLISKDCFDTNPGLWHMAIVNHVGSLKKSFVLDATFDYEVWNQPIISYNYTYFNPETRKHVESIEEARVLYEDYKSDKFKKYRTVKPHSVIGIAMEVVYSVETTPYQKDSDDESDDMAQSAFYLYDLELNSEGEIVGGEWFQNAHPDFLWNPAAGARALSIGDYYLLSDPNWDGKASLGENWKYMGNASAQRAQPLAKVIESLIEISNQTGENHEVE